MTRAGAAPPDGAPAVEARGLELHYRLPAGTVRAVDGIDLDVAAGERVAVMGPSGSGKSSLVALIGALERPTAGTLRVLGADVVGLDDEGRAALRRSAFGFVFQAYDLVPFLTAYENVALQQSLSRRNGSAPADLLARLGMGDAAAKLPDQLSGGQKQRVAIARALAHGPRLIFADEPTGGLDSASGDAVMTALLEASGAFGATLIVVTHDAEIASRFDRVVRLRDGRVVAGAPAVATPVREAAHA